MLAAYGNTAIHTPNLNKLASESVVFKNAYVAQPVCSPNRSTVMTDLWPHQSGVTANNIRLSRDIPCLPEIIDDPDYSTAYMGKWHLGDEIFAQHGFDEWISIEYYDRYYRDWRDRYERPDYHEFLLQKGYDPDQDGKFSRSFAAGLPMEHCKPKFLEMQACDFLRRHQEQPFILYVNFLEPHMPFFGPFDDEHDPGSIPLPPNFNDPLEKTDPLRYRVLRQYCLDKYGSEGKPMHDTDLRELLARYWGLVTQVDISIGEILRTLQNIGVDQNTIIVFTSDHGDMMGAHRLVEKCVMYEEAVKIPWLLRISGLQKTPRKYNRRVSQIDLMPTLLDVMGIEPPVDLPGNSLMASVVNSEPNEQNVFIEWNPGQGVIRPVDAETLDTTEEEIARVAEERRRTVISQDHWKLSLSNVDKCQLFNLQKDPGETTNLYYSGRY